MLKVVDILFIEESGPCQSINEFLIYLVEFTRVTGYRLQGGYILVYKMNDS